MERNNPLNILAIGAHPDDIELGCGGALVNDSVAGGQVYGLILTRGEQADDSQDRRDEAKKAAKVLGMEELFFEDFPDGKLGNDLETVSAIRDRIIALKPKVVYTHTDHDMHQDHRACCDATRSAVKSVSRLGINPNIILMYEGPSTDSGWSHHIYVDITRSFDKKMKALNLHCSQIESGRINPAEVENLATRRAYESLFLGTKYAEAFMPNHLVFKTVLHPLVEF